MFLYMAIVSSLAWAQEGPADKFSRFCNQLDAPAAATKTIHNSRVGNLMAVVDAANGTAKQIQSAVQRHLTFEEFKAEAAGKGLRINDQFHLQAYSQAARAKCEAELTESGPGPVGIQAHSQPTREQLERRVGDVAPLGATTSPAGSTTSEGVE